MAQTDLPDMRYDFSFLSKGRLALYNKLLDEIETQDCSELDDEMLDFVAAAGAPESCINPDDPTERP